MTGLGTEPASAGEALEPDGAPAAGTLDLPIDMERVFGTLKASQRSLLWLAYVEGFKHEEIAEVIGVSPGSVKVLLSRARGVLAAKLESQGMAPMTARGLGK